MRGFVISVAIICMFAYPSRILGDENASVNEKNLAVAEDAFRSDSDPAQMRQNLRQESPLSYNQKQFSHNHKLISNFQPVNGRQLYMYRDSDEGSYFGNRNYDRMPNRVETRYIQRSVLPSYFRTRQIQYNGVPTSFKGDRYYRDNMANYNLDDNNSQQNAMPNAFQSSYYSDSTPTYLGDNVVGQNDMPSYLSGHNVYQHDRPSYFKGDSYNQNGMASDLGLDNFNENDMPSLAANILRGSKLSNVDNVETRTVIYEDGSTYPYIRTV